MHRARLRSRHRRRCPGAHYALADADDKALAAERQSIQQQLNALKAQVASVQGSDTTLTSQVSGLHTSNTAPAKRNRGPSKPNRQPSSGQRRASGPADSGPERPGAGSLCQRRS
jgi:hypothetical protein